LDYQDGLYRIQAGQYDGSTGLCSPRVRTAETGDRRFVSRLILFLVDRDFGLVGTVVGHEHDRVRLAIRGAVLSADLGRWVKKDDVFAVAALSDSARKKEWTLLKVTGEPRDGTCECRLFERYPNSLASRPVGGYRCLKLGTTRGRLHLRLVNQ